MQVHLQEIEPGARPPGPVYPTTDVGVEQPAWKRTHVIWLLLALSLVPGIVAAAFREEWTGLPAGVRMASYIVSGILIVAACALMLQQDAHPPASPAGDHAEDGTT